MWSCKNTGEKTCQEGQAAHLPALPCCSCLPRKDRRLVGWAKKRRDSMRSRQYAGFRHGVRLYSCCGSSHTNLSMIQSNVFSSWFDGTKRPFASLAKNSRSKANLLVQLRVISQKIGIQKVFLSQFCDLRWKFSKPEDWYSVGSTDLYELGFPRTSRAVLAELLGELYPDHSWEKVYLLRGRQAQQKRLENALTSLFPVHLHNKPLS